MLSPHSAVKSSGIFNIIIIMIDIEIKPPPDLNDTYMCCYISGL